MKKVILHLCADIGSDSRYFDLDDDFVVIRVGEETGVENFEIKTFLLMMNLLGYEMHGIIANPVCTEFSNADYNKEKDYEKGMFLVNHCMRIIKALNPKFWVLENPSRGDLKKFLGKYKHKYQPWQYGSPWTKETGLWGDFVMPEPIYTNWEDVPKNPNVYQRPTRKKPSLALFHKNDIRHLPEYDWCRDKIKCDTDIRSLCSDGFAKAFYLANK